MRHHKECTDERTRKIRKEAMNGVRARAKGLCLVHYFVVQTSFCQDVSYATHYACSLFLAGSLREWREQCYAVSVGCLSSIMIILNAHMSQVWPS